MYGSCKFLPVHVQRNRLAGSRRAHGLIAVARETFRPRLVGGAYGAFRKQKGENRDEERRNDYSQTSTPRALHHLCFSHFKLSTMLTSCQDPQALSGFPPEPPAGC